MFILIIIIGLVTILRLSLFFLLLRYGKLAIAHLCYFYWWNWMKLRCLHFWFSVVLLDYNINFFFVPCSSFLAWYNFLWFCLLLICIRNLPTRLHKTWTFFSHFFFEFVTIEIPLACWLRIINCCLPRRTFCRIIQLFFLEKLVRLTFSCTEFWLQ